MNKSRYKDKIKAGLRQFLARYALAMTRLEVIKWVNLSGVFDDFIQSACYSGILPYYTVLPIDKGRTSKGVSLLEDETVLSLRDLDGIKDSAIYVAKLKARLLEVKGRTSHENVADVFALDSEKLSTYPSWAAVLPWSRESLDKRFENFPQRVLRNRSDSGMDVKGMSCEEIMKVDHSDSHARQFFRLKESIEKNGYQAQVGDEPTAVILKKGKEWVWMIGPNGNHRIQLLSSMGYSEVFVKVIQLVDRSYAPFWPNVVRGYFTAEQAEGIFDGIFEGQGRQCMRK